MSGTKRRGVVPARVALAVLLAVIPAFVAAVLWLEAEFRSGALTFVAFWIAWVACTRVIVGAKNPRDLAGRFLVTLGGATLTLVIYPLSGQCIECRQSATGIAILNAVGEAGSRLSSRTEC